MDKTIDARELSQSRRRRLAMMAALVMAACLAFFGLRAALTPSLDRSTIRTAVAHYGDLMASIDVSGIVVPRDELIVAAPFPAEVRERLVLPGASVSAGQILMRLEDRPLLAEIATLEEQIQLQNHARATRALELDKSLFDAEARQELLKIDLESRAARRDRLEALAEIGAISKGELLEAQLDVRRTEVERDQLERNIGNLRATHRAAMDEVDLQVSILSKQLSERRRLAALASVIAPRDGVVTWMIEEAGASVARGQQLMRIADVSQYRVRATASDFYATRLTNGMPARVRIGTLSKEGQLTSISPAEQQGMVTLHIDLEAAADARLRPQLRAEAELIFESAADALIANRGPGLQGSGRATAWVVEGELARKINLELGLSNRREVQLLAGAEPGMEFIISETTDFDHLQTIGVD